MKHWAMNLFSDLSSRIEIISASNNFYFKKSDLPSNGLVEDIHYFAVIKAETYFKL